MVADLYTNKNDIKRCFDYGRDWGCWADKVRDGPTSLKPDPNPLQSNTVLHRREQFVVEVLSKRLTKPNEAVSCTNR